MLDDDSEEEHRRPTQLIDEELKHNDSDMQEDQDKVLPLPGSIKVPFAKKTTKKASNIKMKKIKKPMYKNQNTYGPNSNESNSTYDRQYSQSDSFFNNQNNYNRYPTSFSNSFKYEKYSNIKKRPTIDLENKDNAFRKVFSKFGPATPVLESEETEVVQEKNIDIFDDLKYGSSITLNLIDEHED